VAGKKGEKRGGLVSETCGQNREGLNEENRGGTTTEEEENREIKRKGGPQTRKQGGGKNKQELIKFAREKKNKNPR